MLQCNHPSIRSVVSHNGQIIGLQTLYPLVPASQWVQILLSWCHHSFISFFLIETVVHCIYAPPSVLLRLALSWLHLPIRLRCQQWLDSVLPTLCSSHDINPCPQVWNGTELEETSRLENLQCVSLFLENIKRLLTRFSTLPKWCWHSVHHICSWITYHSTTFFFYLLPSCESASMRELGDYMSQRNSLLDYVSLWSP